jgi:hypothetical protein
MNSTISDIITLVIDHQKHIRHYHRHFGFSYPVSLAQKLYSILLGPLIVVLTMYLVRFFLLSYPAQDYFIRPLSWRLLATMSRLFIAYVISVIVAVPLAFIYNLETNLLKLFSFRFLISSNQFQFWHFFLSSFWFFFDLIF